MSNIDERLSTLEADDKTLFHQIDELKEEVRDIRRLTIAIEKIAGKVDNIGLKVDNVDNKEPIFSICAPTSIPIR